VSSPAQSPAKPDLGQVRTSNLKAGQVRNPHPQRGIVELSPEMLVSVCFDEAVIAAGLSNKEIAATVGIASDSLVTRWRNVETKDCPSLVQVIKLGPDFCRLMYRGFSRRYGWGAKALIDLGKAVGELAAHVED
jgi:hypothetical protein